MLKINTAPGRSMTRRQYAFASGYASNIGFGDPVMLVPGDESDGDPGTVIALSDGEVVDGIFDGVEYVDSLGQKTFRKNWTSGTVATDIKAFVTPLRGVLIEARADGALNGAAPGKYIGLTGIGTVDALGHSSVQLDASTIADAVGTDPVLPFRVVGLKNISSNAWGDDTPTVIVEPAATPLIAG